MNVWIYVFSVLFTPVIEPLGLTTEEVAPAPVAEVAPLAVAASIEAEPRFHGIERMLAELDAGQP
jgi:hypothetical protein